MAQKGNNTFYGLASAKPSTLPEASFYVATDTGEVFTYNSGGLPIDITGVVKTNLSGLTTQVSDNTDNISGLTTQVNSAISGFKGIIFPNVVSTDLAGIKTSETPTYAAPTENGYYYPQTTGTYKFDVSGSTVDIVVLSGDTVGKQPIIFKNNNLYSYQVIDLGIVQLEIPASVAPNANAVEGDYADAKATYEADEAVINKVSEGLRYEKEETVLVNEIDPSLGTLSNYSSSSLVFVPTVNNTLDGSVSKIHATLTGTLVGRTIGLVLLTPTTETSFITDFIGDEYPAEVAGDNVVILPSPIPITASQKFGILVRSADTTKGISNINSGGPLYDSFGAKVKSIASLTVGVETSFGTIVKSSGVRVRVTLSSVDNFALNVNRAGGLIKLTSENKIPTEYLTNQFNWFADKKIVWLGTSIPAGYDGTGTELEVNRYPDQAGRILGVGNMDNQATGGSLMTWDATDPNRLSLTATIAELEAAFPDYPGGGGTMSYEHKLIGKEYDYVVIDHYVNDRNPIRYNNQSAGDIDSFDRATYFGAWNYLIDKIYQDNPLAKIIIVSVPNIYETANTAIDEAGIVGVMANDAIAQKYHLPHANQAYTGYANTINFLQYNGDGTHPINDNERLRRGYYFAEFIKRNP